ncbi:MAG: response regulator, partial [Flavobacteriales bacterium]|nr:response regulator [Flavobacteriales bacterium]
RTISCCMVNGSAASVHGNGQQVRSAELFPFPSVERVRRKPMNVAPSAHSRHILLVDDEDDCNFVTKLVLKKAGHTGRLTCFTSAEEAIDYLRQGQEAPDLMFVDINMPRVTGFEMLETCEAEGLLPNGYTSVVMFSSSNRPADHDKALSFRSVIGYVEKALTVESYERVSSDHDRLRAS